MSATNHTANYNLPQFIGSDKPAWLVDFNGAMADIDSAIYAAKSQADATDLVVTGHTSAIEALQTTESDQGTAITGLRTDVDGNTGSINTINSLIGNGEPTTTDKTLIGAINELHTTEIDLVTITTGHGVKLNNPANNTLRGDYEIASVVGDGVKTAKELLNELRALLDAYVVANPNNKLLNPEMIHYNYGYLYNQFADLIQSVRYEIFEITSAGINAVQIDVDGNDSHVFEYLNGSYRDASNDVVPANSVISVHAALYTPMI